MDPETIKLLQETLETSKENNLLLKKMARSQKMTNIYRVVYWAIILLSSFGAYYFIQPYLGNLFNLYTGGASSSNNMNDIMKNFSNKEQMQDLINSLR